MIAQEVFRSNQSMKPTARFRNKSSAFATTHCRGLSPFSVDHARLTVYNGRSHGAFSDELPYTGKRSLGHSTRRYPSDTPARTRPDIRTDSVLPARCRRQHSDYCVGARQRAYRCLSGKACRRTMESLLRTNDTVSRPDDLTKRWSEPLTGAKIYFR